MALARLAIILLAEIINIGDLKSLRWKNLKMMTVVLINHGVSVIAEVIFAWYIHCS